MKSFRLSVVPLLFLALFTCKDNRNNPLNIDVPNAGRLSWGDTLNIKIKKTSFELDSIKFELNGKPINPPLLLTDEPLGEQTIKAIGYINGKNYIREKKIDIFSDTTPKLFGYEILNSFPHDPTAYTQGLEFHGDTLYESTGLRGESTLRKVDYKTGQVLRNIPLDKSYFGEGITIYDNRIIQLTWTSKIGFVYDLETLGLKSSFDYDISKEGWGLCSDGKYLYKSDGSNNIWILDKETFIETGDKIQATTNRTLINKLNELECHDGYIYANTYQQDREVVVIIDSRTGQVKGLVNFEGLKDLVDPDTNPDVLNGIAYHQNRGTFFVTGKNWDKLFEIKVIPRE
ncbi:MAG: glutaminyl-peptide cyclotransferase [Flavobacteriaceae bacterium]|nr:glutaminyl-peptide cyclotransferase [Flavobacteriaceae bacterium]